MNTSTPEAWQSRRGRFPRKPGGRWVVVTFVHGVPVKAYRLRSLSEARRVIRRTCASKIGSRTAKLIRHDRRKFKPLSPWEAVMSWAAVPIAWYARRLPMGADLRKARESTETEMPR
jgi:hypothetical protein